MGMRVWLVGAAVVVNLGAVACSSDSGGGGGSGGSGGSTSTVGAVCVQLGTLTKSKVDELSCPNDNSTAVVEACAKVLAVLPQCVSQWQTVVDCWAASPDWACDDSGAASPVQGTCQTEYDALSACNHT